jgi:hypothetical protein
MKIYKNINELIQWVGAVFVIAGYTLNAVGPNVYPWNIAAFTGGSSMFLVWGARVNNVPQMIVNIVALSICAIGLIKAI